MSTLSMALPRGIAPELLLSQIENTMPYFRDEFLAPFPPVQIVRDFADEPSQSLSHFEYFRLCVSAHYMTCGTPVPTDVDNQIRQRLWDAKLPIETALEMLELVLASRHWDFRLVSNRHVLGAKGSEWEKHVLSGQLGEWFTLAAGAYGFFARSTEVGAKEAREKIHAAIADEVHRHSEIFGSLWRAQDGLASLKACAYIAHNFGDLDRVMDMWKLAVDDPLRLEFYGLSTKPFDAQGKLRYKGRLWVAGELYKAPIDGSSMALENHRHYALRKPKAFRQTPKLLIPTAPFFDEWGRAIAEFLKPEPTELLEVFETLRQAWEKQPGSWGYGRALRGILEVRPELRQEKALDRLPKAHPIHRVLKLSCEEFEKIWAEAALAHMEEIPSRAG